MTNNEYLHSRLGKPWAHLTGKEKVDRLIFVHGTLLLKSGRALRLSRWYQKIIARELNQLDH